MAVPRAPAAGARIACASLCQITPRLLLDPMNSADRDLAKRAFEAMMRGGKLDVIATEAAAKKR